MIVEMDKSEMPVFNFNNEIITITGRALPENAGIAWSKFLHDLRMHVKNHKILSIHFKLDYFNSASSMYITDMLGILSDNYRTCKTLLKWYYFEADETTLENGEIYQERNRKIRFEFIQRTD